MLSDRNLREINDQIERELKTVKSWASDDDDKNAALERIAKLKNLLNPQPSRSDILKELASALVNTQESEPTIVSKPRPTLADVLVELLCKP